MSRSDSLENERARVFADLVDDLVSDRAPALSAHGDAETADDLAIVRSVKGLLNPSAADMRFKQNLRDRTVGQLLALRGLRVAPLHEMLAARAESAVVQKTALEQSGIAAEQLEGLLADTVPPTDIPPARLIAIADAVGLPARALLESVRLSVARWYERLVQEATVRSQAPALAHLTGDDRGGAHGSIRDEVSAQLRAHVDALEELVRAREDQRYSGC